MWSFNRRGFFALMGGAGVTACGFTPVHSPSGTSLYGRVAYRAPDTVEGFRLRAQLENRLGRVEVGEYLLIVDLRIEEVALVITSNQDINRYNLPGRAQWSLYSDPESDPIVQGEVETFTAYAAAGTTVATREAQRDARDRLAIALADLVVADLALIPPEMLS